MKQITAFGFGVIAVVVVLLLVNAQTKTNDTAITMTSDVTEKHSVVPQTCIIKLPDELDFAGERVPLEMPDVAERLDRELHINVYWHSSTIQILKLANRWLPVIEKVLKQNGVPEDFKYLCVAESNLRNAVSPAGATGFWQFLNGVGKEYGLEISSEVDERYHAVKSTEAACRYLKAAYQKYGSCTMAAASYNAGMPSVSGMIENQNVNSYYDLLLKDETSRYVHRILAIKLILENPDKYGFCFDSEDLYAPLPTRTLTVKETIPDLVAFAQEHRTNVKMLKYHNPWLRANSLTVKGKVYSIELPQ